MRKLLAKAVIVAFVLALPLSLAACGAPEEEEVVEPTPVEQEAQDTDVTTDAEEADEPAETTSDVEALEGEVEGLEGFAARSGFPDVPLPAGVLESSNAEDRADGTRYTLTIVNPVRVDSEAAMNWYIETLEGAGFQITKAMFEEGAMGPSQRFMTIDAEIRAEDEAGLELRSYIRLEDEGAAFGFDVREP